LETPLKSLKSKSGVRDEVPCSVFEAGGFDVQLYATEQIALRRALKRLGRLVVLREEVLTSGRKLLPGIRVNTSEFRN
jgi:hypothetical protein